MVPINFSGPTPVAGWAQLTIRRNGTWNFSGGLRDSGFPSYDDAVCPPSGTSAPTRATNSFTERMHGILKEGLMTTIGRSLATTPCSR